MSSTPDQIATWQRSLLTDDPSGELADIETRLRRLESQTLNSRVTALESFEALFSGLSGLTAYTPTLVQSGAVTKTSTAAWFQAGKLTVVYWSLAVTGSGTGNNAVTVGLPGTAKTGSAAYGSGNIVDASAVTNNPGVVVLASTTSVSYIDSTQATGGVRLGNTGTVFSAALASGDTVAGAVVYEAA